MVETICRQAYTLHENVATLPLVEEVGIPGSEGKSVAQIFREIVYKGLRRRGLDQKQEYIDRAEEEIDLILRKEFAVYFLILWDAFKFCKREGIAVGFGRGSS